MSGADKRLEFLLALQEESGGTIPFARWMQEALYHPEFGYYTVHIRTVGRRGDFSTWATLHRSLGRAVASWLRENRARQVIEIGGGSGELAAEVLRNLGWWNKPRYHIVEISPVLRAQQQARLRGRAVEWHDNMPSALQAAGGRAAIFSNELADAFPCRVFQNQAGTWRELALQISEGRVREVWRDAPLPESSAFQHPWPDGQRVEIQESYRHWLREWTPHWMEGKMLTIDYGTDCPALYHRRPRGTLRGYAHQQRLDGAEVYEGFGRRDITADVNFTDLKQWGNALGLLAEGAISLARFLEDQRAGPLPPEFRGGAGEAFRALVQRKQSRIKTGEGQPPA